MADHIDKNERFEQGMKTRRSVLGDAHVNRAQTMTSGFDQPFQQLITEAAWARFGPAITGRSASARW